MVFLCVVIYFLTFRLLECQFSGLGFWRAANPNLWLIGMLFLGALTYAFNYSDAARSTQALLLLAGASLGAGVRVWSVWHSRGGHGGSLCRLIVATLIVLLLAASLWPPEWGPDFALRGICALDWSVGQSQRLWTAYGNGSGACIWGWHLGSWFWGQQV